MKSLILHVGHGKTGTSYLQSTFALNKDLLEAAGVFYPDHPNSKIAKEGNVSIGNGRLILDQRFTIHEVLPTLLSSEILFKDLSDNDGEELTSKVLNRTERIEIIIYTRNTMDLLHSTWLQRIKRGAEVKTFSEFLREGRTHHYPRLLWWINASTRLNFKLTIRNYSKHKSSLLTSFLRDLPIKNVAVHDFDLPPHKVVNRSLTQSEAEILRTLNFTLKGVSRLISDPLVNNLPEIKPNITKTDANTFDWAMSQYTPIINKINAHLDKTEEVEFGSRSLFVDESNEQFLLSGRQLYVISEAINRLFLEKAAYSGLADLLRDTSLKVQNNKKLTTQDAFQLMEYAQMLKSQPLIQQ